MNTPEIETQSESEHPQDPIRKGLVEARIAAVAIALFGLVVITMILWMVFVGTGKAVEVHRNMLVKGEAAKVIQRLDEVMREGPLPEELNEVYLWAQALNSAQALEHLGQFSDAWTALTTGFPSANQGFGEATKLWQRLEVLKEVEERLKQAEVPTLTETEQLCTRGRTSLEGALTQMMRQLYLRLIDETMRSVDPSLRDAEKARLVGDWPELTYSKSSG